VKRWREQRGWGCRGWRVRRGWSGSKQFPLGGGWARRRGRGILSCRLLARDNTEGKVVTCVPQLIPIVNVVVMLTRCRCWKDLTPCQQFLDLDLGQNFLVYTAPVPLRSKWVSQVITFRVPLPEKLSFVFESQTTNS
jgi:hypothetical protein